MTDEADDSILVCCDSSMPSTFPDNLEGVCAECGVGIFFRPHAPKIKRVCMGCGVKLMEADAEAGVRPEVVIYGGDCSRGEEDPGAEGMTDYATEAVQARDVEWTKAIAPESDKTLSPSEAALWTLGEQARAVQAATEELRQENAELHKRLDKTDKRVAFAVREEREARERAENNFLNASLERDQLKAAGIEALNRYEAEVATLRKRVHESL